jgi:hypothetical protein
MAPSARSTDLDRQGGGSVWAGFTWAKVGYLRDGIAAYLLGTAVTWLPGIGWDLWRIWRCS